MPRPLRIEYQGALYHVISRGDQREPIFPASPDISYPLGWKPSSSLEANEFQRFLIQFYDYSLDRFLDRLKGLG
jgi:hypothetical protein